MAANDKESHRWYDERDLTDYVPSYINTCVEWIEARLQDLHNNPGGWKWVRRVSQDTPVN